MSVWQDLRYGSRLWRQHKVPALLSIGIDGYGVRHHVRQINSLRTIVQRQLGT